MWFAIVLLAAWCGLLTWGMMHAVFPSLKILLDDGYDRKVKEIQDFVDKQKKH
jgi:hypothetical protein